VPQLPPSPPLPLLLLLPLPLLLAPSVEASLLPDEAPPEELVPPPLLPPLPLAPPLLLPLLLAPPLLPPLLPVEASGLPPLFELLPPQASTMPRVHAASTRIVAVFFMVKLPPNRNAPILRRPARAQGTATYVQY